MPNPIRRLRNSWFGQTARFNTFPDDITMLLSLIFMLVFVIGIPVSFVFHGHGSLIVLRVLMCFALACLVLSLLAALYQVRQRRPPPDDMHAALLVQRPPPVGYSANRMNTWLFSVAMLGVLLSVHSAYMHSLEQMHWQQELDVLDIADGPCVAVVQDFNWNAQAPLNTTYKPQCYIGNPHLGLPLCSSLNDTMLRSPEVDCDCHDLWSPNVTENVILNEQPYRVLTFCPSRRLMLPRESKKLILHTFYNFNVSRAQEEEDFYTNPLSNVAIWDPSLTLKEASDQKLTRLIPIGANGITSISLIPNRRQYYKAEPRYDYSATTSSGGVQGLVCDVSEVTGTYWKPCTMALHIQFSTFERKTVYEVPKLTPTDAIAQVGGLFTFPLLAAAWLSLAAIRAKV